MSGLKDFLRGLARNNSDPVSTTMNAYGLGMRRKQSMLDEEYRKRSLGIQGSQVENSRERNRLTGIGHGIAQDRLAFDREQSDPEVLRKKLRMEAGVRQEVAAGPSAYGITDNPTVPYEIQHPGGEELQGPPALGPEPLEEIGPGTRQPWTERGQRPATDAEIRRALGAAQFRTGAIDQLPKIQAEQAKQSGILGRKRTESAEGLYPGVQALREKQKIGLTESDQLKGELGLLKATTEKNLFTGEQTYDDEVLSRLKRRLALKTQTSTAPADNTQAAFDRNIQLDPTGQTSVDFSGVQTSTQAQTQPALSHKEVYDIWLPILQDPTRRAVMFSQMKPDQIPALAPLIKAMQDSGMIDLTDEEVLKLVELGYDLGVE